jgi:hypothetical protein
MDSALIVSAGEDTTAKLKYDNNIIMLLLPDIK